MSMWDENQIKRKFLQIEHRSNVKDTLSLFEHIETQLNDENINTRELNQSLFAFSTKINRKKIDVEIRDTDRENLLEISAISSRKRYLNSFYEWSNKQIFGLKYSLWVVLMVVAVSLVPLIISLAVQDTVSQNLQDSLRIVGIALISIGGTALVFYFIFARITLGRQTKLYEDVSEFVQRITKIISRYKEDSKSKKVCWKCYKEIDSETSKCPHCGTEL